MQNILYYLLSLNILKRLKSFFELINNLNVYVIFYGPEINNL